MSHRAPGTDGNASVADGGAAFTASMMCGSIFGDESTKEHVIPSLLQHFRPPLTHDLPILEHCLLPTLTDRSMVKAAQKVLKIVKSEDTEGIKAQHRPTDGSFNLKLRIGETFHLKSTGECGVIAGWEAREGDRIKGQSFSLVSQQQELTSRSLCSRTSLRPRRSRLQAQSRSSPSSSLLRLPRRKYLDLYVCEQHAHSACSRRSSNPTASTPSQFKSKTPTWISSPSPPFTRAQGCRARA